MSEQPAPAHEQHSPDGAIPEVAPELAPEVDHEQAPVPQRTMTIAEASQATGLTPKAIQRRIDRGNLPSVLRDGKRRIPVSELVRVGLLSDTGQVPASIPRASTTETTEATIIQLVDRLLDQERQLGELRALTQKSEQEAKRADQEAQRADDLHRQLLETTALLAAAQARLEVAPPARRGLRAVLRGRF